MPLVPDPSGQRKPHVLSFEEKPFHVLGQPYGHKSALHGPQVLSMPENHKGACPALARHRPGVLTACKTPRGAHHSCPDQTASLFRLSAVWSPAKGWQGRRLLSRPDHEHLRAAAFLRQTRRQPWGAAPQPRATASLPHLHGDEGRPTRRSLLPAWPSTRPGALQPADHSVQTECRAARARRLQPGARHPASLPRKRPGLRVPPS